MEKIKTEILTATKFDAYYVAKFARQADVDEIWSAMLETPYEAILQGMKHSDFTLVGLANGIPVCIWGIANDCLIFNHGTPWMVASNRLDDKTITRIFLKQCRPRMMEIMEKYDRLENYVDARNLRSKRWLRFMGFTLEDPEPYGFLQLPFHRFWIEKEKSHV